MIELLSLWLVLCLKLTRGCLNRKDRARVSPAESSSSSPRPPIVAQKGLDLHHHAAPNLLPPLMVSSSHGACSSTHGYISAFLMLQSGQASSTIGSQVVRTPYGMNQTVGSTYLRLTCRKFDH
uniref:Secreted protein n=1 Tax=Arundo donax TaxID=35708 RepID=A0A0A9GMJ7_ARUDO